MKNYSNLTRRSRLLLLMLFALLAGGVSPAWAETKAEGFASGEALPDGWSISGGGVLGTAYSLTSDYNRSGSTGDYCLGRSSTSDTSPVTYIITPTVTGTVTIYYRSWGTGSGNKKIFVYKWNGTAIEGNSLGSDQGTTSSYQSMVISLGTTETQLAIRLQKTVIDDFTAEYVVEGSCAKPQNLTYSNLTDASATITWDEGDADTWNLRYKADGDADFTEVNGLTSATYALEGLDAATTYTVQVQTVCSTLDQSKWTSVGFTTPLCSPSAQKNITLTMWDTYGDGWNNAYLQIVDKDSNIEVAKLTLTSADGTNHIENTVGLCPNREYNINWISGNYNSECRFTIKDVDGNIIDGLDYSGDSYPSSSATLATYSWSNAPVADGAQFAINTDGTTQDFGFAAANEVAEKTFTITNNGNASLTVSFTASDGFSVPNYVLFTDAAGWGSAKIYYWGTSSNPDWPGIDMTEVGTNDFGQKQFKAIVPEGVTGIVFNNGSEKTVDISYIASTEGYYTTSKNNEGKYEVGSWGNGPGWNVGKGDSRDFTVVMNTATAGVKSGNIELSFNAVNATNFTIPVTGRVADPDKYFVNFSNNTLPDGWTNGSNNGASWTFANGVAYGQYASYKNAKMMSPLLTVAEGESLVFQTKGNSSYSDMKVNVYQRDGSTKVKTVDFSTEARAAYSAGEYTLVTLSGLDAGDYKLEFEAYNSYIDNINGFTLNLNDPKMGVYSDAECNTAVANTSVTEAKGFVTEAPAAITYYIKNDGTGTMNLEVADNVTGMTAALGATALTAGQSTTLTLTKDATKGFFGGDAVVTAEGLGTFTVNVTGVLVDENKCNLDFTTADIPATWTKNNWSKNANGYVEVGYSSSTMQTSNLVAAAGENLVVYAKQSYTSSSYTFGVKYKNMDDAEADWVDLIPAANIGTDYVMLHGAIATAGTYQLQFTGNYTQIKRIYGLSKPDAPEMVVYDGEAVAGDSYSFGKVTDEADATWTLTVKNEGEAELTGLAVALTGDNAAHYTAVIGDNKTTLAKNETATITVTQLKDNLGSHSATLTISATGLESKVIALSGTTVDHTILNVDFDASSEWPAEVLEHGANWTVYNYSNSGEARQGNSSTATSLTLTPLTVASTEDKLTFDVAYYSTSSSRELTVSYTTDGGLTWKDYNWGTTEEPVYDLKQSIGYSYATQTITGIPAGTVVFKFTGKCIKLDNISGDMKVAQAPLVTFTETANNIDGANLKADGTATYTLANNGNADYVGTVALTNVTAEVAGDDVTYASNTLTIPAGKTATITVTMAFAAPYGEKTGNLSITSEGWVGDITANYTANLVDPTDFVEDFTNGLSAGWYNAGWTVSGGVAYVYSGTDKKLVTEKLGVATGKNVLSFDAKVYSGDDEQTLKVYTSEDRFNWTEPQSFTLTSEVQHFSLEALTANSYVLFEAANASIDNLTGVKKLALPAHDLVYVSVSGLKTSYIPGETANATLQIANVLATDEENVNVWAYCRKNGETTYSNLGAPNQAFIAAGETVGIPLTVNAPTEEGTYDVKIIVSPTANESDAIIQMAQNAAFTVAHTRTLTIDEFEVAESPVQADDNNEFTATFNVQVTNTGSKSLAADEVSVTLTDTSDSEKTFTATWSAATSDILYMNTKKDATDISDGCTLKAWCWNTAEDGVWSTFTNINDGFWSVDLQDKTNFIICRFNPNGTDADPWNNVWNRSGELSLTNGNLVKFSGYNESAMNFSQESMTMLEPTMSTTLKVTVTGAAGKGGTFSYRAKENVSNTTYGSGLPRSVTVTPTTVDIAISEYGYATFASEYALDLDNLPNGLEVFYVTADNIHTSSVGLTEASGKVKKGTGLLLKGAKGSYTVYATKKSEAAELTGNLLVGCLEQKNLAADPNLYVLSVGEGDRAEFQSLSQMGATIPAGKAYLDASSVSGAGSRLIINFDDVTGINAVENAPLTLENCYNLQGQKVENVKKGGLYIINGRKVVIK